MQPILFEYWRRNESARVQRRAEMAAMVREAELAEADRRSSREGCQVGPVMSGRRVSGWRVSGWRVSGWRRSGRVSARAVAFGQRVAGHLTMPVTLAPVAGKRG